VKCKNFTGINGLTRNGKIINTPIDNINATIPKDLEGIALNMA